MSVGAFPFVTQNRLRDVLACGIRGSGYRQIAEDTDIVDQLLLQGFYFSRSQD
jgi:hypothetical protein